jgi:hypothetical protein
MTQNSPLVRLLPRARWVAANSANAPVNTRDTLRQITHNIASGCTSRFFGLKYGQGGLDDAKEGA